MSAASPLWVVEDHDGVLLASYDCPPMNYAVEAALTGLEQVLDQAARPGTRGLVLAGRESGRFITHFSAEQILDGLVDRDRLVREGPERNRHVASIADRLGSLPVPVLAALNGDTMGFGFELSLACDLRVGQLGDYRYGLPEVRLGIIPGGGGTQRLTRLLGTGRALDLILRARLLTPPEALAVGVVEELADDAVRRGLEIVQEIATLPPLAVAMAKQAVRQGVDLPLAAGVQAEAAASLRCKLSDGAVEALTTYTGLPFDRRRDWLEGDVAGDSPANAS